jgi:hypothetical protein
VSSTDVSLAELLQHLYDWLIAEDFGAASRVASLGASTLRAPRAGCHNWRVAGAGGVDASLAESTASVGMVVCYLPNWRMKTTMEAESWVYYYLIQKTNSQHWI